MSAPSNHTIAPASFLSIGRNIMNRSRRNGSKSTERARYKAMFGTSPEICSLLWDLLQNLINNTMPRGARPTHLLWALMLMKVYSSESVLAATVGGVDEKTFRKWAWKFIYAIDAIEPHVIVWKKRFRNRKAGDRCFVTVDGTDFRVCLKTQEKLDQWKTHKFNGPGVRYEVGVSIRTGDIVWVNGPFKCGNWPDINIFRSKMKFRLRKGEMVEADKGYAGDNKCFTPYDIFDDKRRRISSVARSRHETANKRFKQWGCLSQRFRHAVRDHGPAFRAVAVITQLSISFGDEPLFSVDYL